MNLYPKPHQFMAHFMRETISEQGTVRFFALTTTQSFPSNRFGSKKLVQNQLVQNPAVRFRMMGVTIDHS